MPTTNKTISITYFARKAQWAHRVIQALSEDQRKIYESTPCPELVRSIDRKAVILDLIGRDFNQLTKKFNSHLKERSDEIRVSLERGTAINLSHEMEEKAYRLILLFEAYITGLQTYVGFHHTYLSVFYKRILGTKRQKDEPKWKLILGKIRHDFIHNYSSWISFRLEKSGYTPVFNLAESLSQLRSHKYYKKYSYPTITINEVNELTQQINMYFDVELQLILSKLSKSRRP